MLESFSIQLQESSKPLKITAQDFPSWEVSLIGEKIESILDQHIREYDPEYDDWGASFCWLNAEKIEHVITVWSPVCNLPECNLQIWATKPRIFWFRKNIPIEDSDFFALKPLLDDLIQELSQSP